eukprot:900502-Pleurochrysis_carterae.AAC.2
MTHKCVRTKSMHGHSFLCKPELCIRGREACVHITGRSTESEATACATQVGIAWSTAEARSKQSPGGKLASAPRLKSIHTIHIAESRPLSLT